MNIAFIFFSEFDVLTPLQRPVGGSESACSYLAIELAKLGHNVFTFTINPTITSACGVQCRRIMSENEQIKLDKEIHDIKYDAIVLKNGLPELAFNLKSMLKYNPPIYFWSGHAADQPAVKNLENSKVVSGIDKFVCVSNWQRDKYIERFQLDPNKVVVCRNAISPAFENLFVSEAEFAETKSSTPLLAYTSTPFRGLGVLLNLFPELYKEVPSARLDIFSSMKVYNAPPEHEEQFEHYYQQAKNAEGVNYFGSLIQANLAAKLRSYTMLSYPNTFLETSCIAVMEAMAAGMEVITTCSGALPETCLSYGTLIPTHEFSGNEPDSFLGKMITLCKNQLENRPQFLAKSYQQVVDMNTNHTWRQRAREWQNLISS